MSEQPTFFRAFPASIEQTGPRQLTGRLVPYDRPTDVLDVLPTGKYDIYREGFRPGAFAAQANNPERGVLSKIGLIHSHEGGLGYLGPFVGLREEDDGLYGEVNILRSRANDVEDLLAGGIQELSVEFRLPRTNHTAVDDDGVRWRTRAHLDQVALEPKGAYSTARVLAYRKEVDEQLATDAEEETLRAALAAEAAQNEERAAAAIERKRKFDELVARYEPARQRQGELVDRYGFAIPPERDIYRP